MHLKPVLWFCSMSIITFAGPFGRGAFSFCVIDPVAVTVEVWV